MREADISRRILRTKIGERLVERVLELAGPALDELLRGAEAVQRVRIRVRAGPRRLQRRLIERHRRAGIAATRISVGAVEQDGDAGLPRRRAHAATASSWSES